MESRMLWAVKLFATLKNQWNDKGELIRDIHTIYVYTDAAFEAIYPKAVAWMTDSWEDFAVVSVERLDGPVVMS